MAHGVRRLALTLLLIVVSSIACGPSAPPQAPAPVVEVAPREAPVVPLPPPVFVEPQWKRSPGPPLTLTASDAPTSAAAIRQRVKAAGGKLEEALSLRFVLTWETDANDVDFHIYDATGGHAF
jgi:hypothetical protein